MKLYYSCVLFAFLYSSACDVRVLGATPADANKFIDTVLTSVAQSNKLGQSVNMPNFDLLVKAKSITNADISGKFRECKLTNFAQIKRKNDCQVDSKSGEQTIKCQINLSGLLETCQATLKGFTITGAEKTVDFRIKIQDSPGTIELVQRNPQSPPTLKTLHVETVQSDMEFADVGFNEERKGMLKAEVKKKFSQHFFNTLYNEYKKAVEDTLKSSRFPN